MLEPHSGRLEDKLLTPRDSSKSSDPALFRHIRKIHKYLATLERRKALGKPNISESDPRFSDVLEPLSQYFKSNFLSDFESTDSLGTKSMSTLQSNFSNMSLFRNGHNTFTNNFGNFNKGSTNLVDDDSKENDRKNVSSTSKRAAPVFSDNTRNDMDNMRTSFFSGEQMNPSNKNPFKGSIDGENDKEKENQNLGQNFV